MNRLATQLKGTRISKQGNVYTSREGQGFL